jgi:four helix bundle protein
MNGTKVNRFEDLIAWQKARELTAKIYQTTSEGNFAKDFGLRDQIRRASVSMMSNIAEGFERYNPNEFHHFLSISKASCGEVRSQLYVAFDVNYIAKECFAELRAKCEELSRIIGGLRASVERQKKIAQ